MNASIRWFVNNPVAANLLMFLILIGGFFGAYGIGKEVFPSISVNYITVNMPYPGAGPKEVEEQIKQETKATIRCIPLEKSEAGKCIVSGAPSAQEVLFAIAY